MKLFRASYFDSPVYRRTYCDPAYLTRDIVGSHRLEKHRWQMHLAAFDGNVGELLEELEELRRMHDRVRASRAFDHLRFSDFSVEVTAFGQPLGSHNR